MFCVLVELVNIDSRPLAQCRLIHHMMRRNTYRFVFGQIHATDTSCNSITCTRAEEFLSETSFTALDVGYLKCQCKTSSLTEKCVFKSRPAVTFLGN